MEFDKFVRLILLGDKRVSITHSVRRSKCVMNWSTYHKLANLTKYIDYGCKFTNLGCKEHRFKSYEQKDRMIAEYTEKYSRGRKHPYWRLMCCCSGCRATIGHLRSIPIKGVQTIARHFHYRTGFWREGKGCVLPRKYRSYTCLNHSCRANHTKTALLLLRTLTMSEHELLRGFDKNHKSQKYRGSHGWSVYGIVKYLKEELQKERKERRK